MIRTIRQLIAAGLLVLPLLAAAAEPDKSFVPILYKVSDRDNSLYVLGSIHQLQADSANLPASVKRIFDQTEITVYELKPEDFRNDASELIKQIQAQGFFAEGDSLGEHLDSATLARVRERMAAMKLEESQWQRMKPWYAGMLMQLATLQKLGLQSEHGVDLQLIDRGITAQKQQEGLETIAEQIGVLASTPLAAQASELRDQLNPANALNEEQQTAILLNAYAQGNVRGFERLLRLMRRQQPTTYKTLIEDRNRRWIPRLRPYLDARSSGDVMVVVGTLHVVGEQGIVNLLRKAGYRVERVTR